VVEQGPRPEEEERFTPAVDLSENPEPINEQPIELTAEEWQMTKPPYEAHSEEVRAFMEAKGISYGEWVKVRVGDRILLMTTDPDDFGTAIEI
jgi:hypothetical protein